MITKKINDLTVRISTNKKDNTTKIVSYRKGGFKRAFKAILPMCDKENCRLNRPHSVKIGYDLRYYSEYHPCDVDVFVKKLIKTYVN